MGALAVSCALLFGSLFCSAAFAAQRGFDSVIAFEEPRSVATDGAGDVWISKADDVPFLASLATKFSPYPSHSKLATLSGYPAANNNTLILGPSLGYSDLTNELFFAHSSGRKVEIFDENGVFKRQWGAIDENPIFGFTPETIWLAVDNSTGVTRGAIYLSLKKVNEPTYVVPANTVEAFDADQNPVDFPATASYISGNKLTGTPSGPFGTVESIAVDPLGNLFVQDITNAVVDEFDRTGTFLRSFPGIGSPPQFGAGIAADPTNGNLLVEQGTNVSEYDSYGNLLNKITTGPGGGVEPKGIPAVNADGYLYFPDYAGGGVDVYKPAPVTPEVVVKPVTAPTITSGTLNASIDPSGGGAVTKCRFEYGTTTSYSEGSVACSPDPNSAPPGSNFSTPTNVSAAITSLTTGTAYHYRVVAENANGVKYSEDQIYRPQGVLGLTTDGVTGVTESSAMLHGSFVGNTEDTHYYFEWGPTTAYGQTAPAPAADAGSPAGPARTDLPFEVTALQPYSTYHYRVAATNGSGTKYGEDRQFTTAPGIPSVSGQLTSEVHADRAVLHADVNPNGADTTYHFEYVDDATFQKSEYTDAGRVPAADVLVGRGKHPKAVSRLVSGLKPGTLYHYRAVATNVAGTGVPAADHTFKTFPFAAEINDPCPNAHVRQQTGAALLLDCRAYELVSASNSGGYDVESTLVSGQTPFSSYPNAVDPPRVLYGVHDGALGTGNPTGHGVDPYVATRGSDGWQTEYVGIPSNNPNADGPFASTLAEADTTLSTFAFGGPEICDPCFADESVGYPVHQPNGELVQGMTGSLAQPSAVPAGFVGRHFSADGSHFVFGSESKFEPDGNEGEVSIYDRDLSGNDTHVVSKTPASQTMTESAGEIGELDISSDGSRILIGQLVSETGGAKLWHLYMNVGDADHTIDLTPGTASGVLFAGMTADGSKVFFTTADQATLDDEDNSVDLYQADVTSSASTLTRVSIGAGPGPGGPGNSDLCEPAANTVHEHWNTVGSEATCGVVAVGGGGGVASDEGTIYFLSPELLDGGTNGVQDAPNLYVARPGVPPRFIATLESSANAPLPPPSHPFRRSFGSMAKPTGVAIDPATGDVYVLDITTGIGGRVQKFDSSGNFIATLDGSNTPTGPFREYGPLNMPTEVAVDGDPGSPSYRDLYVPDLLNSVVDKFGPSGNYISQISVEFPSGVAVNPANGHVYVTSFFGGTFVFDANGAPVAPTSFSTTAFSSTSIAVDSTGTSYVADGSATTVYDSAGNFVKTLYPNPSNGVAVDPADDHVYVDAGSQVIEFDTSGVEVGTPTGAGAIEGSFGLAANSGNLYISNPGNGRVLSYGPGATPPDSNTDNPLVVDSVSEPGVGKTADFQTTASGDDAVFPSTLPLTNYDNDGNRQIFRYHGPSDGLDCVSCNPTGERATASASLPAGGSGLAEDGRVFFNSDEGLVDRDLNGKQDAYEWEEGQTELISTGAGPFATSLLGISADGADAYFFTREKLATEDKNGNSVKIYDARAFGGFPFVPANVPCKASDECHGPGSSAPPPPSIRTVAGRPEEGASGATKCKRGYRNKHGKCVKKRHKRRRRHTTNSKQGREDRTHRTRRHG